MAVSEHAWYSWVTPGPVDNPKWLISVGFPEDKRLIIGKNICFQRSKIAEEYSSNQTQFGFLDIMSLHTTIGHLFPDDAETGRKRFLNMDTDSPGDILQFQQGYKGVFQTTMAYLGKLPTFLLSQKYLQKGYPASFTEDSMFQNNLSTCAQGVLNISELYQKMWPMFQARNPHPATLCGLLEMSKPYLVSNMAVWNEYMEKQNSELNTKVEKIHETIYNLVQEALSLKPCERLANQWLMQLDWSVDPIDFKNVTVIDGKLVAKDYEKLKRQKWPKWVKSMWNESSQKFRVFDNLLALPYLLKLKWNGANLLYMRRFGWVYYKNKSETDHGALVNDSLLVKGEIMSVHRNPYFNYYRLPSAKQKGKKSNSERFFSSPLFNSYLTSFENGQLSSDLAEAKAIFDSRRDILFWQLQSYNLKSLFHKTGSEGECVHLPSYLPFGTKSKMPIDQFWKFPIQSSNLGHDLRSAVKAPSGYKYVSLSFKNIQHWLTTLCSDKRFGFHGSSIPGYQFLQGSEEKQSYTLSQTIEITNLPTDMCAYLDTLRIFGHLDPAQTIRLMHLKFPGYNFASLIKKVLRVFVATKGVEVKKEDSAYTTYIGGSESLLFNELHSIVRDENLETMALQSKAPLSLGDEYVKANVILLNTVLLQKKQVVFGV